jgi:lipoprotein-releasing system permease protein
MPMPSFVAGRYLLSSRYNRYIASMTLLSIAGISVGISAMINVMSVINGFEKELRDRFLAANAHILAFQYPSGIDDPDIWTRQIKSEFGGVITGISPFIHTETMATKDGLMHNILIKGIEPHLRADVQDLRPVVRPATAIAEIAASFDRGASPDTTPRPIILGSGLLSILQLKIGETVKLIAPEGRSIGEFREFRVVGVYDSGLKHYDNKIGIMALNDAQTFFRMKNRVHGVEIGLKNPRDSIKIAAQMSLKYSLTIKEWQSFNKQMFEAMETERAVIALIVALVAFVASFNILTTLFISVTQKQRSISIFKALGASNRQVQWIFICQGLFIGVAGAIIGMILAFGISKFLETFKVIDLPDLYLLAKLPVTYDWSVYLTVAGAGCLICVLAGIYPAFVASRMNIAEGFRGQKV